MTILKNHRALISAIAVAFAAIASAQNVNGTPVDLNGRYFTPNGTSAARTIAISGAKTDDPAGVAEATYTPFSDAVKAPADATVNLLGRSYSYVVTLGPWTGSATAAVTAGALPAGLTQTIGYNGTNFTFTQGASTITYVTDATSFRVDVSVDGTGDATTTVTRLNGSTGNASESFAAEATTGLNNASFQVAVTGSAASAGTLTLSDFVHTATPNSLFIFSDQPYLQNGGNAVYRIGMANLAQTVRGWQGFLSAGAGQTFVSGAYTANPFPNHIIDPITNALNLASGVNPGDPAVNVNATLAELTFTSATASTAGVTWRANNPPTRFVSGANQPVSPVVNPSNTVIWESTPPTLGGFAATQGGPNRFGAFVKQGVVTIAFNAFDGGSVFSGLRARPTVSVDFQPAGAGPEDVTLTVFPTSANGFSATVPITPTTPSGLATVTFAAIDDSGNATSATQSFEVRKAQITLSLTAQGLTGSNITRQVDFSVGGSAGGPAPISFSRDVVFNSGSTSVVIDADDNLVDGAAYTLVGAKDPRHTLRRTVGLSGANSTFTASATMRSGDASGDNVIDILDYGILAELFGQNVGGPNTPIGFSNAFGDLHPDYNGDGNVTSADATFVVAASQFLQIGDAEPGGVARPGMPKKRATVQQMKEAGVRRASEMDLNRDGWINVDEITGWLMGKRK
jgi:hypothetical protein